MTVDHAEPATAAGHTNTTSAEGHSFPPGSLFGASTATRAGPGARVSLPVVFGADLRYLYFHVRCKGSS